MRVSDKMSYDQVNRSVSKNRSEMAGLQNQAATQKRVTKPSDDPVAASRVLANRTDQRGIEQYIKNLNYARGFLDFTEQSLNELTETLVRAKELAISQSNDASANSQSRKIVAEEVKQLRNQAVQIANRKLGDRFIFGGFKTTKAPFAEDGSYNGDMGEMRVHVDKESFLSMNLPGSMVFHGKGLSQEGATFLNERQAQNVEELKAQHKTETFNKEVMADEWEEMQKPVQSSAGSQRDSVTSRGPASLRPPEVEGSQSPYGNKTEVGKIDQQTDGENIFNVLKKLEIALMTNDKTGVQESLDRIDSATQQIVLARTSLGSRVTTIDNTLNSLHSMQVDNKATISSLEDADAFEVISDINKTEGALQATLQTSGKLIQKSLMDFIS